MKLIDDSTGEIVGSTLLVETVEGSNVVVGSTVFVEKVSGTDVVVGN